MATPPFANTTFADLPLERWQQLFEKALKGKGTAQSLTQELEPGVHLPPIATQALSERPAPAFTHAGWRLGCHIPLLDEAALAQALQEEHDGGAEAAVVGPYTWRSLMAMRAVKLPQIESPVQLRLGAAIARELPQLPRHILAVDYDPLTHCLLTGSIPPDFTPSEYRYDLHVDALFEAGATATQQLAYALWLLYRYKLYMEDQSFGLIVAIGPNYLLEIAKLRALHKLLAAHGHAFVHTSAEPSFWAHGHTAPYDNLIRLSLQAMAGVIGGAEQIVIKPFDAYSEAYRPFSSRLARGLQHLLREESHLDKVADPAAGAYHIEHLTQQLVAQAEETFERWRRQDWAITLGPKGIAQEVQEAAARKRERLASGQHKLVGVNLYPPAQPEAPPAQSPYPDPDSLQLPLWWGGALAAQQASA